MALFPLLHKACPDVSPLHQKKQIRKKEKRSRAAKSASQSQEDGGRLAGGPELLPKRVMLPRFKFSFMPEALHLNLGQDGKH